MQRGKARFTQDQARLMFERLDQVCNILAHHLSEPAECSADQAVDRILATVDDWAFIAAVGLDAMDLRQPVNDDEIEPEPPRLQ